jgi:hypothetical protein
MSIRGLTDSTTGRRIDPDGRYSGKTANTYRVSSSGGSFSSLAEAFAALGEMSQTVGIRLLLDGGEYPVSDTLTVDFPFPIRIEGSGSNATLIQAATGLTEKPMFVLKSDCDFHSLTLDGSTLANYDQSDEAKLICINPEDVNIYCEVVDAVLNGAARGVCCQSDSSFFVFNFIISNMSQVGIGYAAPSANSSSVSSSQSLERVSGALDIEIGNLVNCAVGINLYSGEDTDVFINTCRFLNEATQVAINYRPDDFQYSRFVVTDNDWNEVGTFLANIDLTTERDADIFVDNNVGVMSYAPHFVMMLADGTATTTCTNQNTWYKATIDAPTYTKVKFASDGNKMTYLPTRSGDILMSLSMNISAGTANRTLRVGVIKNGVTATPVASMSIRFTSAGQPWIVSYLFEADSVAYGDYFEIWYNCTSASGTAFTTNDVDWVAWRR